VRVLVVDVLPTIVVPFGVAPVVVHPHHLPYLSYHPCNLYRTLEVLSVIGSDPLI